MTRRGSGWDVLVVLFEVTAAETPFVYNVRQTDVFWILDQELISYGYSSGSSSNCWGRPLQKSLGLRSFKSDRDEIWEDCSEFSK